MKHLILISEMHIDVVTTSSVPGSSIDKKKPPNQGSACFTYPQLVDVRGNGGRKGAAICSVEFAKRLFRCVG